MPVYNCLTLCSCYVTCAVLELCRFPMLLKHNILNRRWKKSAPVDRCSIWSSNTVLIYNLCWLPLLLKMAFRKRRWKFIRRRVCNCIDVLSDRLTLCSRVMLAHITTSHENLPFLALIMYAYNLYIFTSCIIWGGNRGVETFCRCPAMASVLLHCSAL